MTLERYWPQPKKLMLPINYFRVPEDEWFADDDFRTRVLAEWQKIPHYLEMGYLTSG
jgi:hypothetical protein